MRRSFLTIVFLTALNMIAWSQQSRDSVGAAKKEKIEEIIYDIGGGEPGFDFQLKITRDSINYQGFFYSEATHEGKTINKKRKNVRKRWRRLIKLINLTTFDQLKNGPLTRAYDGVDSIILINTQIKHHQLILDNQNRAKINDFICQIKLELKESAK